MKKVRMIPVFLALVVFLTACSNQEDQQAVSDVENLISAIETENLEEETINSARAAYDALDDVLKEKVTNYQDLLDAETEYEAQLLQEREKHREELLKDVYNTLYLNIAGCAALREGTVSVWKSAIDDKYADFNDALSALFQGSGYSAAATSRTAQKPMNRPAKSNRRKPCWIWCGPIETIPGGILRRVFFFGAGVRVREMKFDKEGYRMYNHEHIDDVDWCALLITQITTFAAEKTKWDRT